MCTHLWYVHELCRVCCVVCVRCCVFEVFCVYLWYVHVEIHVFLREYACKYDMYISDWSSCRMGIQPYILRCKMPWIPVMWVKTDIYIYIYIHIYIYIYNIHVYPCIYLYIYVYICTYVHIYMQPYILRCKMTWIPGMRVKTGIFIHMFLYNIHIYPYVCIYNINVYVCIYLFTHVLICTYIHLAFHIAIQDAVNPWDAIYIYRSYIYIRMCIHICI